MKIKMKRIKTQILRTALLFTGLLMASCNNLVEGVGEKKDSSDTNGKTAVIRLSLAGYEARTALPTVTADDFESFTLVGKRSGNEKINQTFSKSGSQSAYAVMTGSSVTAEVGDDWTFTLTASKKGLVYSDTTSYASATSVTASGISLTFNLVQTEIESLTGTGSLNVAVTYPAAGVESVTVTLQKSDGTLVTAEGNTNLTVSDGRATYANTSLSAGQYKLIFKFYGDSEKASLLGSCMERAIVADGLESSSSITLTSFDAKKSVTYVTDKATLSSETVYYSRQSALASLKSDATKAERTFCGWYRESNYSGEAVTDVSALTSDSETLYARWGGAALDITIPVGAGAGKTFASAYLHIPGVAIADFDDDGFDILSGESAVINNHASIDLSGKKFVDGTENALAGYTAGTSGNMTLRVQMGAVDASSGKNLASTKLIITLVDTSGGWYLTYIDGANFTAGATAYTATGSALTAFAHSKTATINGQSYTIATHNVGGYSPEDVGTYRQWSASAPSFVVSGFKLPALSDIENFVQDSATAAATSSQITGLHGYTIGGVFFPAGGYRASTAADSAGDNYNCELDYWSGTASTINMTDFAYSLTGGSDALTTGVWKKDQYFTVRLIQ